MKYSLPKEILAVEVRSNKKTFLDLYLLKLTCPVVSSLPLCMSCTAQAIQKF